MCKEEYLKPLPADQVKKFIDSLPPQEFKIGRCVVTFTIPMHTEVNPLEFLKGMEAKTIEQIIEESKK